MSQNWRIGEIAHLAFSRDEKWKPGNLLEFCYIVKIAESCIQPLARRPESGSIFHKYITGAVLRILGPD